MTGGHAVPPSQGTRRPRDPWTNTCELPGEVPQEGGGGGGAAPRTPEPRIWLGYGGEGGGGCGQPNPATSTAPARAPIAPSPSRIRPASSARCAGLEKALRCSTVLSTKPGGWNPESGQSALGRKRRDQRPWEGGADHPPQGGRSPDPRWVSPDPRAGRGREP